MENAVSDIGSLGANVLVGLSRTMILFIVSSGMSFVLGVMRLPNLAHGSLYMIGAFAAYSIAELFGGSAAGFWIALALAPVFVAILSLVAERALFCHLYQREHLELILFTFALMLILGDMVKLVWGTDYKSILAPETLRGSVVVFGASFPVYNFFLIVVGPLVGVSLWLFTNKTKMGKITRAAAVDREMVDAVGINVDWVFCGAFVIGCLLAGLGGALVAPTVSITLGMDHTVIMEAFLIVTIGGLGNIVGALLGSLIFGFSQAFGVYLMPQFAIVFPYVAVVIILLLKPKGLLKSAW
jgi:branched-subunit amino acid ABC-type transport system permease component